MKESHIIHPFLFAIFPTLFLFSHNIAESPIIVTTSISRLGIPIVITLFVTSFLWFGFNRFFKEKHKAGILLSIVLFMFFSCGHFHNMMVTQFDLGILFTIRGFIIGPYKFYAIIWGILLTLITYFLKKARKTLVPFTHFLNIFAVILVMISVWNIASFGIKRIALSKNKNTEYVEIKSGDGNTSMTYPDIYYIILDEYAAAMTLKDNLHYDNQEFLARLTEKGFYIVSKSLSNYPFTVLSLASSLNMEYVNYLNNKIKLGPGLDSSDIIEPIRMVENSSVMRFLKSKGYRFIHFKSGYPPTEHNKYADWDVKCDRKFIEDRFIQLVINMSMIAPFFRRYASTSKRGVIQCQFNTLTELQKFEGPIFVFAHIMLPHEPYVFGKDGEPVSEKDVSSIAESQLYINQLIFLNKEVLRIVDGLLLQSESHPIIILQGDHGKRILPWKENKKAWMRILNAYYLPRGGNSLLYKTITPVNTFRLIFNYYFGTDYDLLDDQSYYLYGSPYNYQFIDITNKVKYD